MEGEGKSPPPDSAGGGKNIEMEEEGRPPESVVGSYVGKGKGRGICLGKVISYEKDSGLFTVSFEDECRQQLDRAQLGKMLLEDESDSNPNLTRRKRKLDQVITYGGSKRPTTRSSRSSKKNDNATVAAPDDSAAQASSVSLLASKDVPAASGRGHTSSVSQIAMEDASKETDSSTDSCDDDEHDCGPQAATSPLRENPIFVVPLPPSSGDLSVPEESVSYLFSIYNFLRSFSLQLFLSPFGLDEFVGCLNCTVQNSLLDAIHLSLMRALRRHLQMLSSDGSEMASKCLRHCDWTLLDALTWPAILLEYLFIMGYAKGLVKKGFNFGVSAGEYYGLPVAVKLEVMQILCDNVIDSEELRTELYTRVGKMEEGGEYDASGSILPETENGPRRVHPRYSKTSACKNLEALENSVESKLCNPDCKVLEMVDTSSDCQDGNSDECRLCGMNGSLVCCDGCPSAYHIRCIGLYKSFLPDGLWFCPECTVNKLGKSSSRIGRGASGAEIFGTDANGWVFLGTCNYLLVVGVSSNSVPIYRYYNQDDVSKVLTAICLIAENASVYADICRGISRYWEVPLVTMQSGKPEPTMDPWVDREPVVAHISSSTILPKGTANPLYGAEVEKPMTNLAEGSSDNTSVVCQKDFSIEAKGKCSSLELLDKVDFPDSEKHDTASLNVCTNEMSEAADKTLCPVKERQFISGLSPLTVQKISPGTHAMIHGHPRNESMLTDNLSYSNQPISAESSVILDAATCELGNRNSIWKEEERSSTFSTKMEPVGISTESRIRCYNNDEKYRIKSQMNSSIQSIFKPHAYINLYVQGDIAATAAAIAVQVSEESKVSEARVASNPRKAMAEKFALETKAFSIATSDFLWPSFEKIEAPRAKCGWCSACSVTYKKGCLLNLAANKSSKRFARNSSVMRPNKPIDNHIPTIAAQIAHMEESLQGLVDGPLSDAAYNKQWRKLIREASSCRVLNFLLLELEKSIRGISFSAEWSKLVDDSGEFSSPGVVSRSLPGQKHGPGRRRKKPYVTSEAEDDTPSDSSKTLQWWRGGRLSKIVFQKRTLCSSLVKKAGRQGGSKRIPGIHYPEVSGLPRRSRQLAWRASVQMSKNLSHLALQVRYLEAHIRWRDLVRPEENPSDGKGSEVDAMAFRNAVICDKRITENRISYALTFAIQKHLPLRVTKNILETETTQDGNGKSWFYEDHVPLYLIKEYETKAGSGMKPLTCPPLNCQQMLRSRRLPKLEIRQLKGQDDIFLYLIRKRDAVRCSTCRVYYQKDCTITSPAAKEGDLELFTCTKCYRMKFASLVGSSSKQNSNTQLHLQGKNQQQFLKGPNQQQFLTGQNQQQFKRQNQNQCIQRQNQLVTSTKLVLKVGQNISARQVGKKEVPSEISCSASGSKSERKRNMNISTYGLIWKRMRSDGPGKEAFRMNHIILKKTEGIDPLRGVTCCLCNKPYCADLMYVCCELCRNWYHADAVELEEAQIFDLVGFKCGKCRRRRSPRCPYSDLDYKKPNVYKFAPFNVERNGFDLSEAQEFVHPSTSEFNLKVEDFDADALLYSLGKVEPVEEGAMASEVQCGEPRNVSKYQKKLSVRRPQVKHEFSECVQSLSMSSNPAEGGMDVNEALTTEEPNLMSEKLTQVEWDCSQDWGYAGGDFGSMDLGDQLHDPETGITDMEYEPQTYFSFTELLAADDGQIDGQYDMSTNMSGDWSLDNSGTTHQDVPPYGSSGPYEMGTHNQFATVNKTAVEGVACEKCKLNQPSPDLVCEICDVCVHSHCFPGEESKGAPWRCNACRDWQ